MADAKAGRMRDTPLRYGLMSRLLHWLMAYLLVWQFLMAIGWRLLDKDIMQTASRFGPAHASIGWFVLILVMPRLGWAVSNRRQRPPAEALSGAFARAVHALFYVLMLVVPALALLRAYGSGKGLAWHGVQLVPRTAREVGWLQAPADLLHAPLAWTLAILMSGHVAMAFFHAAIRRDGTLGRMI